MKRFLVLGLLLLTLCTYAPPTAMPYYGTNLTIPPALAERIGEPKLLLSSYYSFEGFSYAPNLTGYDLPLSLSSVYNHNEFKGKVTLTSAREDLLTQNGFVVLEWGGEDMVDAYEGLKNRDVPIFVTTDSLLHMYHVQFDETLKSIEEREFYGLVMDMASLLMNYSAGDYQNLEGDLKEAAKRNTGYFAVGLKLLEPDASVPSFAEGAVNAELALIEAHSGLEPSPIFKYKEDYSQYVPRGHYTRSETLKRYFKAMMWFGRISFLLKGCDDPSKCFVTEYDSNIQTMQASLIVPKFNALTIEGKTLSELWTRLYSITAFYVGLADDLTPYEYEDALGEVFGSSFDAGELADEAKLLELKAELAQLRLPEIYGGTGQCVVFIPPGGLRSEDVNKCLKASQGMRFMGQRFVPDSFMFQNLVAGRVHLYTGTDTPFTYCMTQGGPARCFPRGLDVMAVLGSERAKEILNQEGDTEYVDFWKQFDSLKQNFSELDINDWNRNAYWGWLYSLKALMKNYSEGYPSFMRTTAWQDKNLNTVLASWAELRHDTILYAKQSYTPIEMSISLPPEVQVVGYVEPVPEFYARLEALTKMTQEALSEMDVLTSGQEYRFERLVGILGRLKNISIDELEGRALSQDDYDFIKNFADSLEYAVTDVEVEDIKTTLIADVHTDLNTEKVLEEGVGEIKLMVVAYQVPDGHIFLGAGPVFSYYEFKHPIYDRLTDEKWREMLEQGTEPEEPEWTSGFIA